MMRKIYAVVFYMFLQLAKVIFKVILSPRACNFVFNHAESGQFAS
jgi:hypothetical protein